MNLIRKVIDLIAFQWCYCSSVVWSCGHQVAKIKSTRREGRKYKKK